MSDTIISLCDMSGNMVKPWAAAGFDCLCIDTQHKLRSDHVVGNITYRWGDVRSLTPESIPKPSMIFAFPPCTHLSLSGARDWSKKGIQALIDALTVVESCRKLCEWFGCPWMIENPMSRLSTCWRKPDHKFTHWNFGDLYQKETWLWGGNGFVMPEFSVHDKPDGVGEVLDMSPSPDRAKKRSETSMAFAAAVFDANHENIREAK